MSSSRRKFIAAASAATLFPAVHSSGAQNTDRIRIGQIGTKHAHASGKMATMRKLGDLFEVVGVAEPDPKQRQRVENSESYRDVPFLSAIQLLSTPGLAAVAVESSVNQLVDNASLCIEAGKHIHLDKPAGTSLKKCKQLHADADAKGLTIQMGYMLRYNPAFVALFQMVRDGWLGPITELSAAMGKRASDILRSELAGYAGGGMFELSCHVIDAMVTILGKPDRVTAHNRRSYPEKDSFADNQLAVFDFPHALATVRCDHLDPFGFPNRHFNVVGESGTFQINPLEPPQAKLGLDQKRGEYKKGFQELKFDKPTGRYDEEFRDLAKVIRGEKKLAWDSKHDIAVQETILRASGMPVD